MKSVTVDDVMAWEPCGRYTRERVIELFAGRASVTALDILDMDDVLHGDRVEAFLCGGFIDYTALRLLACDFAEHVLPLFETEYPGDDRPRKLVGIARRWLTDQASEDELERGARAALESMRQIALYPEVKETAAGNAVQASAKLVIVHWALAYSCARSVAQLATRACNIGGNGRERRWQVKRIREVLEESRE